MRDGTKCLRFAIFRTYRVCGKNLMSWKFVDRMLAAEKVIDGMRVPESVLAVQAEARAQRGLVTSMHPEWFLEVKRPSPLVSVVDVLKQATKPCDGVVLTPNVPQHNEVWRELKVKVTNTVDFLLEVGSFLSLLSPPPCVLLRRLPM